MYYHTVSTLIMASTNLVQEGRLLVTQLSPQEIQRKAERHLLDAIGSRTPNNNYEINRGSTTFRLCYNVQTSLIWSWILFGISFVYMYLIIGQPNNRLDRGTRQSMLNMTLEWSIVSLFWADIAMEAHHKHRNVFDRLRSTSFNLKLVSVALLTLDQAVFLYLESSYPLRPFRFVRALMPYYYEQFSRKALLSLLSTYKDIVTYLVFYVVLIVGFAFVTTQLVSLPASIQYDEFMSQYNDLGKMSFLMYVLASYDAWPDYELKAVDANRWNYILFVSFIFLNCFYFVTIPTTVIFNSFKSHRSKLVIRDQVKQKQSLMLCYCCLGSQQGLTLNAFNRFMTRVYKYRPRYVGCIAHLTKILDPTLSSNIVKSLDSFLGLSQVFNNTSSLHPPTLPYNHYYDTLKNLFRHKLNLKRVTSSDAFEIAVVTVISANLIVIMRSFYGGLKDYQEFQTLFFHLFGAEIVLRLLGSGFQEYLADKKNWLDLSLFGISLSLSFCDIYQSTDMGKMVRMVRLFRLTRLTRIFLRSAYFRQFVYQNILLRKLRILFGQLVISSIVGLKMFPLFCTSYYILGLVGMEAYDNRYNYVRDSPYRYSLYDNYSSFRSLIESQLVIVQVMIEAGWSPIVFDYAYRYGNHMLVFLFFVVIHIVIVIILVSLMKGLVSDLYETIYNTYIQIQKQQIEEVQKQTNQNQNQNDQYKRQLAQRSKGNSKVLLGVRNNNLTESKEQNTGEAYECSKANKPKSPTEASISQSSWSRHLHNRLTVHPGCSPNYIPEALQVAEPHVVVVEQILSQMQFPSDQYQMKVRQKSKAQFNQKTSIDIDRIMRQVFLSNTRDASREASQFQYLHNRYKESVPLQDNTTHQRVLTSYELVGHLGRALRSQNSYGLKLSALVRFQYLMAKKVIGKGSLFKVVMQSPLLCDKWFYFQFGEGCLSLQFIQQATWIELDNMHNNQTVYWNDILKSQEEVQECIQGLRNAFIQMKSFSQQEYQGQNQIDASKFKYDLFMCSVTPWEPLPQEFKCTVVILTRGAAREPTTDQSRQDGSYAAKKMTIITPIQVEDGALERTLSAPEVGQVSDLFGDLLRTHMGGLYRSVSDFVLN